jgi:hypothetical protein
VGILHDEEAVMKRALIVSLSAALTATAAPALAFDTGPHFEATRLGLARAGFSDATIDYVRAANFQTDYAVNQKAVQRLFDTQTTAYRAHRAALYFHFDHLPNHEAVARDFAWIEKSAQSVVTGSKDPVRILNTLGIVLHAVQDFYSHSSIVDREWFRFTSTRPIVFEDLADDFAKGPLAANMWASVAGDRTGILTGRSDADPYPFAEPPDWPGHGNDALICEKGESAVTCGLNHDHVPRRGHLTALLSAAEASRQWARKIEGWVNDPVVWASVKSYSSSAIPNCLKRAHETSEAAGTWSYPRSVSELEFVTWAATGTGCDDGWQDRWNDTIVAMYLATNPKNITMSTSGAVAEIWPNAPEFTMPTRPAIALSDVSGVYSFNWGDRIGVLTLTVADGKVGGTIAFSGLTHTLTPLPANGPKIELRAAFGAISGDVHFFTASRNAVAGFLRDGTGVPNGFYATK